jgi:4Fe-4S ferredoxin
LDGEENSTIVQNEAFPVLSKKITLMKDKCAPECNLACQKECPTEAIKVTTKNSEKGEILRITDVEVEESSCLYCKRCELSCNQNAIIVEKPFMGRISITVDLCPEGCEACADICPTHAIQIENGKPQLLDKFCIFCSACQKVCPEEAINMHRDWVFHSEIKAAAWLTALRKLTSCATVAKELRIKNGKTRAHVVRAREMHKQKNLSRTPCIRAEEFLKILNNYKK